MKIVTQFESKIQMKRKNGFTLIELLVVIAIIALLLSVIMPALGKAKKLTKSMVCKTNLRSLQLGNRLYTEDNDGTHIIGGDRLWVNDIATYLEDVDKARYCPEAVESNFTPDPSNPTRAQVNGTRNKPWGLWNEDQQRYDLGAYTINNWLYSEIVWQGAQQEVPHENSYTKAGMIQNTGIVPVFMDGIRWGTTADNHAAFKPASDIDWENGKQEPSFSRVLINRHSGNGNVVFYDGHAEQVFLPEYFTLKWHKNSTPNHAMMQRVISENQPSRSR